MEKNSAFVGVALSVVIPFYLILLRSVSDAQVVTTQPMNVTVCLTQNQTGILTCVVDTEGEEIFTAGWHILARGSFRPVTNRPRHMTNAIINNGIITDTLTVTNVSVNDNGALYRCQPSGGVPSMNVTITVLDPPPINNIRVDEICSNDFTISWTPTRDDTGLYYNVILTPPGESLPTMDTYKNFTELTPNTNYDIIVVTQESMGCVGIPMVMMITTVTRQATAPRSVSNLRSSRRTFSTITVVWDLADSPNCGPVLFYDVTRVNVDNVTDVNITITTENEVEFSNLINGTSYNISVSAVNRADSGPTTSIIANTTITMNTEGNPAPSDDDEDNTGAIIGGTIGGITFLIFISASTTIIVIWGKNHNQSDNGEKLTSSQSPESPPVQKSNKKKTTQEPVPDAPQYADLQHGASGAPPSVDHCKVAYSQVKEHEPLNYAEVTHQPGAGEKPIQGAPQVEYKEVWHQ